MSHNRTPTPEQGAGNVLIVFAKLPVPGEVKTRLAKGIGPEAAAEHYRAYSEWVLANSAPPVPGMWRRWVAFSPRTAQPAFLTWLRPYPVDHLIPQAPGDLGVRLMAATGAAFHADASRVVVIGTDCLDVNQDIIEDAFAALDEHDVVLGPSHDGGYYLIGIRETNHRLFQGIPWSTEGVKEATAQRIQEMGLSLCELETLRDIDQPEDLAHLPAAFLAEHPELTPTSETQPSA